MFFFFKQRTAYEMRISDWSSDVCSSDLFQEMHRSLLTGEATLPDFLGGEGNDRRGVADKRMEQRVEHSAIGASLGICGRVAVEAIFADIEKESAEIILCEGGERAHIAAECEANRGGAEFRVQFAQEIDRKSTRLNSSH